jgi:hypothetical protein
MRNAAFSAILLLATAVAAGPASAEAPLAIELNKLEPLAQPASGCRLYFVASNPDADSIRQLRLELILFGTDGVIARRVAVDLGPLRGKKATVRAFDLEGLACDAIDHALVNNVLACDAGGQAAPDAEQQREACLDRLAVTSHAKAALTK